MYHIMVHNGTSLGTKSCKKVAPIFYCEKCDYTTSRKSSWEKHLQTKKHNDTQMVHNGTLEVAKSCKNEPAAKWECVCGKSYKYHSGYYRHKSKCTYKPPVCEPVVETNPSIKEDDGITVNKDGTWTMTPEQMLKGFVEVMKDAGVIGSSSISGSGSHNTINNQKIFNVNLFLNEQCANAMSIQDFAKQLQLTMNDLDKSKPECITNVVLKNLKPMALTERPFHCTDAEAQEWFVKDQDKGWQEDDGEKVIQQTENGINKAWPDTFEEEHPNWKGNDKLHDKYVESSLKATQKMSNKNAKKVLADIGSKTSLTAEIAEKHNVT